MTPKTTAQFVCVSIVTRAPRRLGSAALRALWTVQSVYRIVVAAPFNSVLEPQFRHYTHTYMALASTQGETVEVAVMFQETRGILNHNIEVIL
jgi:hypothetical protein